MFTSRKTRSIVLASAIAMALATGISHAQQSTTGIKSEDKSSVAFNIPAQALSRALSQFGDTTGYQLVYEASLADGKQSASIEGGMAPEEALRRMLYGTGLTFRFTSAKTVAISRAPDQRTSRVLGPVRVEGAEQLQKPQRGEGVAQLGGVRGHQDDEERGLRPVVATAGTGVPTAIEDIPRIISVLTQEQMQQQDITDIGEALRRLPGLSVIETTNSVQSGAAIISRGVALTTAQIDGDLTRPLNVIDNGMLDIGPYERIELARGPNGVFVPTGSPGGTLNLVRKRPGADNLSVTAIGGSWNRRQLSLDYSTLNLAGSAFGFRGVATYQEQEYFYENSDRRNWLVYGMFDAPLGENARIEIGFQHSDIDENGSYNGMPRYADGALMKFPYTFNYVPEFAYTRSESTEAFGKFIMDLPAKWKFELGTSYQDRHVASLQFLTSLPFLEATNAVRPGQRGYATFRENTSVGEDLGITLRLSGRARTFGIDHNLLLSSDYNQFIQDGQPTDGGSSALKWIYTIEDIQPTNYPPFTPRPSNYSANGMTVTRGIVIQDTLSWRDWVDVNASVRRSDSKSKGVQYILNESDGPNYGQIQEIIYGPANTTKIEREPEWRPSWSVTVKPLKGLSIYGSHSTGMEFQDTYYTRGGDSLGPLSYESDELGVKYGTSDWVAQLAVYDMVRTNMAAAIPGTQGMCPPTATSPCYVQLDDSLKSRGVDAQLDGEILPGLGISSSYNYNKTEKIAAVSDWSAEVITQAPAQQARLQLDWQLPFLARTSVNVGAMYRSSVYQAGTRTVFNPVTGRPIPPAIAYEFREPSSIVLDMGVRYEFSNDLSLNLLVENITDKRYLSTVSSFNSFYGRPRAITATVNWKPFGTSLGGGAVATNSLAPFGEASRWYGGLELGGHDPATITAKSSGTKADGTRVVWDFKVESAEMGVARVGYRLSPHWRMEAEAGLRAASFGKIGGGSGTAPRGVCDPTGSVSGRPFDCDNSLGDIEGWSVMFNGLYDFRDESARVRPFVGLGAGVSYWAIDFGGKLEGVGLDTPWPLASNTRRSTEAIAGNTAFATWSWQAMAGTRVRLTDRAYLNAAYTFFNAPDIKMESFNLPTLTPTLGTFRGEYKDHAVSLGVRWHFGRS